jgi:hypothetical protein
MYGKMFAQMPFVLVCREPSCVDELVVIRSLDIRLR